MADAVLRLLEPAEALPKAPEPPSEPGRPLWSLVEPGRLVELSAPAHGPGARFSTAAMLVRRAQQEGETTVWVQPTGGSLYPPDLHAAHIDLDALVVVHVPRELGVVGLGKATELLLRSGAFGMVVVDLGPTEPRASTAWQGRLLGLARQHEIRVVLITTKPTHADSLGPLVGLRVEPRRERVGDGEFVVRHHVLKNKSGGPVTPAIDRFIGPPGLR